MQPALKDSGVVSSNDYYVGVAHRRFGQDLARGAVPFGHHRFNAPAEVSSQAIYSLPRIVSPQADDIPWPPRERGSEGERCKRGIGRIDVVQERELGTHPVGD